MHMSPPRSTHALLMSVCHLFLSVDLSVSSTNSVISYTDTSKLVNRAGYTYTYTSRHSVTVGNREIGTGISEASKRVPIFPFDTQGGKQASFYFRQRNWVKAREAQIRFPAC